MKILDPTGSAAQAVRAARMERHDSLPAGLRELALDYDDQQVIKAANWLGTLDVERVRKELVKMFGPPLVPKSKRRYKRLR